MNDIVVIRDKKYKTEEFSNSHLAIISKYLVLIQSFRFNLDIENEIGTLLKEVIIPTIDENSVKKIQNRYVILLDMEELGKLSSDLSRIYAERRLALARKSKDNEKIERFTQMKKELDTRSIEEEELNNIVEEATALIDSGTEEDILDNAKKLAVVDNETEQNVSNKDKETINQLQEEVAALKAQIKTEA